MQMTKRNKREERLVLFVHYRIYYDLDAQGGSSNGRGKLHIYNGSCFVLLCFHSRAHAHSLTPTHIYNLYSKG